MDTSGDNFLDDAVLQRVEGDDAKPAARRQDITKGIYCFFELSEFIVDFNPNCLKRPFRRVRSVTSGGSRNRGLDDIDQLGRGFNRRRR